jgi:alkanesulfonate monooxygenase SsuD/methylene tetrahydromethanopterin reductase-like flavin-dependent oxidoreductase (luciferase family)
VPRKGYGGVFWLQHWKFIRRFWDRYGELYEEAFGRALAPGENRLLVLNTHIQDTHEKAWEMARPTHDEFWKFLGPYGWSRGYMGEDGKPVPPGLIPTLEQSVDQKVWVIGTPEEVAEGIDLYVQQLGLQRLTIVPMMPGDSYDQADEQMTRFAEEVLPLLERKTTPVGGPATQAVAGP